MTEWINLNMVQELRAELASVKAERDALRDALEKLARLGNEPHYGNSIGNEIARAALNQLSEKAG